MQVGSASKRLSGHRLLAFTIILPLNVIERHLYDIAAFIISANVLFTRFSSQVGWISEKEI